MTEFLFNDWHCVETATELHDGRHRVGLMRLGYPATTHDTRIRAIRTVPPWLHIETCEAYECREYDDVTERDRSELIRCLATWFEWCKAQGCRRVVLGPWGLQHTNPLHVLVDTLFAVLSHPSLHWSFDVVVLCVSGMEDIEATQLIIDQYYTACLAFVQRRSRASRRRERRRILEAARA